MNVVIRVSKETQEKMIKYYKDKKRDKEIPYVVFQAVDEDTVITMYTSGKIMFQGTSADVDANMWKAMDGQSATEEDEKEKKQKENRYYYSTAIGSDEVGTGDYFGPIIVTSCYVKKEDIPKLEKLGIKDSKKITDDKIKKIIKDLLPLVKYKSIIVSNKEYNEKYGKDYNINKIKAIMHNKVLWEMAHEETDYDYIIIDEFARENRYYEYIKDSTNIQKGITFMTKAEDKNMAVGAASIISRYIFLKEFDKLSDELHVPLPKGAGKDVDKVGEEIVEKYGEEKLKEVAKLNFKNTERILHTMIF
ncbi:MAG: ribonuclease HIII [Bacilli bacterium]|nr:ribonuclease HIII [Bacilli bacterium]